MEKENKVDEKEELITRELSRPHPKVDAYSRILAYFQVCLEKYSEAHPDRVIDDRFQDALKCSLFGVHDILEILEDYDISYKKERLSDNVPGELEDDRSL